MSSVNGDVAAGSADVGYLLREALQRARADGMALIAADAAVDGSLTPAHARLLGRVPPEGARVTDLAAQSGITKQALGQLAGLLADRGYVEIVSDPGDRRARLIRCTERGERVGRAIRAAAATIEDGWRAQVGADRYAVFREVLAELGGVRPPSAPGGG